MAPLTTTTAENARMDEVAANVTKWDKLKVKCTLGYVMWPIWPTPEKLWGQPNGRAMTQDRKTTMYKSFLVDGIQNAKNDTVILVVAKKSWIKQYLQVESLEGLSTADIPPLEWTNDGKVAFEDGKFCPVEGMGRRAGIQMLYELATKEIEMMTRELENGMAKKNGSGKMAERDKTAKMESIKFKTVDRDRKMMWALRIIDYDLLKKEMDGNIEPALDRWARNETRAITKEGDDEKFVMWAKQLLTASRQDEAIYRGLIAEGRSGVLQLDTMHQKALQAVKAEAMHAAAGHSVLFHCGDVEELLRLFLTLVKHFRRTKVFSLSFLKDLIELHGGITSQIIKNAYWQMEHCTVTAGSAAIPFEKVQIALTEGNDEELCALREQVVNESHDTAVEILDGELMNKLNLIFIQHYVVKKGGRKEWPVFNKHFAANTPEGRTLWKAYHEDVIEATNEYDSTPREGWPPGVTSRLALLLYWSPNDDNIPLPILGESSVLAITSLCASVPLAMTELAQWHDPLAHWSKWSATKDKKVRDASGAMLRSIQQDPAIHSAHRDDVRNQVGQYFYNNIRTKIGLFHLELHNYLDKQWIRPEQDEDWKSLFTSEIEKKTGKYPASGNTTNRYKTKAPLPNFNPFRMQDKTDREIAAEVEALLTIMEQTRSKLNADRRHNDASVRSLVTTTATWNRESKAKRRDFLPIACWAVLESYWVKGYRREMFENIETARIIRSDLSDIYQPFVISDQMVLTPHGGAKRSNDFPWVDMLSPTRSPERPGRTWSVEVINRASNQYTMSKIRDKEIMKIISTVQNTTIAHNDLGPPGSVDRMVVKYLKALVRVLEQNADRTIQRFLVGNSEAPYDTTDTPYKRYNFAETFEDPATTFEVLLKPAADEKKREKETTVEPATMTGKAVSTSKIVETVGTTEAGRKAGKKVPIIDEYSSSDNERVESIPATSKADPDRSSDQKQVKDAGATVTKKMDTTARRFNEDDPMTGADGGDYTLDEDPISFDLFGEKDPSNSSGDDRDGPKSDRDHDGESEGDLPTDNDIDIGYSGTDMPSSPLPDHLNFDAPVRPRDSSSLVPKVKALKIGVPDSDAPGPRTPHSSDAGEGSGQGTSAVDRNQDDRSKKPPVPRPKPVIHYKGKGKAKDTRPELPGSSFVLDGI